jgi:Domain of unknown function (DUF4365)
LASLLDPGSAQVELNDQKDYFSRALVRAIAATAGVEADVPSFDQDSRDVVFRAPDTDAEAGPMLEAQLKCSAGLAIADGEIAFPLPIKNFDDLRRKGYVPRILIVVDVPEQPIDWMACDPAQIIMRRCAYWVSLAGEPDTDNVSTVTVKIPIEQVFDGQALLNNLQPPGANL